MTAAARLFSERGYHGTSMQDLAEALGLLRGSLYAHIGSKQELLYDVVDEGARRFLERAESALAGAGPAAERLRRLLVGHIEVAIDQLEAGTVFLNEWRYLDDDLRSDVKAKRDRYESLVRRLLQEGVASGELRADLDIHLAARAVLSCANWIYAWYRPAGELSPSEIGEAFTRMLIEGFEARKQSGQKARALSDGGAATAATPKGSDAGRRPKERT